MKEMRYLNKGDKITLVAPSFGCTTEPYLSHLVESIKNLKEDGFEIEEGENIYLANEKARSNTARKCAKEFNKAYLDSNSKAIISVGGGEIMCEILPYIDFDKIKKAPSKIFMGFSDNTNLTYTLTTICDVKTIYGPCATNFFYRPYQYNLIDAIDILYGKRKIYKGYPYWQRYFIKDENNPNKAPNYVEPKKLRLYPNNEVSIKGRLLGGCMDVLSIICGTRFDNTKEYIEKYKQDGIIWYLEACELNSVGILRVLFQLKEAGWFKYVKGFILGRPLCYHRPSFGMSHYTAIKKALKSLNVPIIMDADLGHYAPSMPIINGALVQIDANENIIFTYLD